MSGALATLVTLWRAPAASGNPAAAATAQPLLALARRLMTAMELLGAPFTAADVAALRDPVGAQEERDPRAIEALLDTYCLAVATINPEMRVSAQAGASARVLVEGGWRTFLVKVINQAGATAPLKVVSPNAQSAFSYLPPRATRGPGVQHNVPPIADAPDYVNRSDYAYEADADAQDLGLRDRWLDLLVFDAAPLTPTLSGAALDYRIVSLYSRDAGKREATLSFDVGQGSQDLGFRSELALLFDCLAATTVRFRVRESSGQAAVAGFVIQDAQARIYPSRAKRLAPDLAFQPQIYRSDGESLQLPPGRYQVQWWRGPESVREQREIIVRAGPGGGPQTEEFVIRRWIDPSSLGYWSGDHHIHAAGCAHYVQPTEGVRAADMVRQLLGEDLKVGANLTWGPGFDYQKQFFSGHDDAVSRPPFLLHYDIEVSGFGSHQSGHLVLLGLKSQIYPGGDSDRHWPTLGLNTLKWAKAQGAICGAAHSGWGLAVEGQSLPNFEVPAFDGIGANEFIVDITHEVPGADGRPTPAIDFLSLCDTPYVWELNMWYQVLNAGFRVRAAGETDFPCIYGERVGMGRSYVELPGPPGYREWCAGLRDGRSYVSDGRVHLFNFRVGHQRLGAGRSELPMQEAGRVMASVRVAALLPVEPDAAFRNLPHTAKPYWHLERARRGATRTVSVELLVNGNVAATQTIDADGRPRDITFRDVDIARSSWLAVRVLPAAHTNPIFMVVGGKPIRASRRSIQWCLHGVDRCWSQKQQFIHPSEMADAREAYEHARAVYRTRLAECAID